MGDEEIHGDEEYVAEQEREAAEKAVEVGGGPVPEEADEAERALAEAGGGESEGFEEAEEQLTKTASHEANRAPDPTHLAGKPEDARQGTEYGGADTGGRGGLRGFARTGYGYRTTRDREEG